MVKTFIAATAAVTTLAAPVSASQFPDVSPENWAYQAILSLKDKYGCAAGFPSGNFKPDQLATRAELAALVNACIDRISEYQSAEDARLAAALKEQAAKWQGVQSAIDAKNNGVGNYIGLGVNLNRQGVDGNGYEADRVIAGATLQARYAAKTFSNENAVSIRPYLNAVAGPNGEIGTAGGALISYDVSVAKKGEVSSANIYGGVGYQAPFVNNSEANFQSAIGDRGQVVFALGLEGRISNSLVGFGQVTFPTTNAGNSYGAEDASYSPVVSAGLGFKF